MVISVIGKSLVALFVLVILLGIGFGVLGAKAEILSPITTAAQVNRVNMETEYQRQVNDLNLRKLQAQCC